MNNTHIESGKKSILQKPVEEADEIELKYDQNHLTFNFALIDYRSPEKIKYLLSWMASIRFGEKRQEKIVPITLMCRRGITGFK